MIALKIIGILLAVFCTLIAIALMLNLRIIFVFNTERKLNLTAKLSFITLFDLEKQRKSKKKSNPKSKNKNEDTTTKKKQKPNKIAYYFLEKFGLDPLFDSSKLVIPDGTGGISESVNKVITLISLILGEIPWILRKITVQRFHILAICGGSDAADAAMEYGIVCAAVYPLVGYIEANLNTEKNSTDIQVGCDFENEAYFETDFNVKLRLIHLVRAIFRNAMNMAQQSTEA